MNLNRLHYLYASFQYNGNVRNKWELSEILLLPGGAPFLSWSTLCCLEVPFPSRSTLGRMKYPKYHTRYPNGAYWYPTGTLISKCLYMYDLPWPCLKPWRYSPEASHSARSWTTWDKTWSGTSQWFYWVWQTCFPSVPGRRPGHVVLAIPWWTMMGSTR